jgi:hypothetical protein
MNFLTKEGVPLSIEEAKNQIKGIWSLIGRFGATSNQEREQINEILERLESGKVTPEEAVKEANEVLVEKNGFETMYR